MKIIRGKKQVALVLNYDEVAYISASLGETTDLNNQEARKQYYYKNTKLLRLGSKLYTPLRELDPGKR